MTVALAATVMLPPGFAAGRTKSAAISRPQVKSVRAVAAPSSKAGRPKALTAPAAVATAVSAALSSRSIVREASDLIVVDPLAPAVPGELVVVLDEGASAATSERALEARGASVERVPGDDGSLLVQTPRGVNDPVFNVIAAQLPGVERVQPNYIYRATYVPSDPLYPEQWGLPRIGAPAAWNVTRGSGTVLVAVVDTGADASHPDLRGRVSTADDYDFVNGDTDARDDNGHGTHVSGIIAAAEGNGGMVGVAPGCRILPVKVLDAKGSGTSIGVAAGIRYAADNGAKIINLSLAGPADPRMGDAVAYARDKGCVIVAAVGNEGSSAGAGYPARYTGVIGVGAVTSSIARASFSNFGPGVDIAAPGVGVLSAVPGGGYESWSGTSMASPFVAGVAALVLSVNPRWSAAEVTDRILSTAQDIGNSGADSYYGRGLVRADLAVAGVGASADDDIPGIPLTASPVAGALSDTDEDDVYSVYLGEGQTLHAALTGASGTDFDLQFYAPTATTVGGGGGRLSGSMTQGYPETVTYTASETGWYYLDVSRYSGAGAYTLDWRRTGTSDDNLPGAAIPGSPVVGTLDSSADIIDVYSVELQAGQQLTLFMNAEDQSADYDLWLYGPGSTGIDIDSPLVKRESPYSSELLRYAATRTGTYSVAVFAYSGSGGYELEWSRDRFTPDDNIPGVDIAPSAESTTVGGLSDTDDVYRVFVQAGQTIEATLSAEAGTDPKLYVFDPTSTDVDVDAWVAEDTSSDLTKVLNYTAAATGYHYMDVYSGGEPGAYRLECSASVDSGDNIPGLAARSAHVSGALGVTTDTDDVYRIHAVAGQKIFASLTGFHSRDTTNTDFDLYVYGPAARDARTDTPLAKSDGAKYAKSVGFTARATGDYYLLAHAFAGKGTYSLDWWVRSYVSVGAPVAPSKATRGHRFTVYGYVSPAHSSATYYLVKLYFYRLEHGRYVYRKKVMARRYSHSARASKYKVTTSLPSAGRWRVRAYHSDSAHVPTYSGLRYITIR